MYREKGVVKMYREKGVLKMYREMLLSGKC